MTIFLPLSNIRHWILSKEKLQRQNYFNSLEEETVYGFYKLWVQEIKYIFFYSKLTANRQFGFLIQHFQYLLP